MNKVHHEFCIGIIVFSVYISKHYISFTFDENFCDLTVDKRELIREQKKDSLFAIWEKVNKWDK